MKFFTMDDFDFSGKTVLVRVDINSPYDTNSKKLIDSPRIRAHSKTIYELQYKKAKVVVLAHQGRKGDEDFINLEKHADLLNNYLDKKIEFVDDIVGEKAKNRIKSLKNGEAILLDNVRFLDDETKEKSIEEHANSTIVKELSPLSDYFILDGFSAAHRAHASVVGFSTVIPSIAGRVMERELNSVSKAFFSLGENFKIIGNLYIHDLPRFHLKWDTFILGGAKVDDCLKVMERVLSEKNVELKKILLGGLIGNLFLHASGIDINEDNRKVLEKTGYLGLAERAKKLLEKNRKQIVLPDDVAIEENGERVEYDVENIPSSGLILDVGKKTVDRFREILRDSKYIIVKGPLGMYEKSPFGKSTKEILEEIAELKSFSLIGGGDTSTAIELFNIPKDKFSYISLAGGALIDYLSKGELPGIKALEISYKKFSKKE
ncbi:MAG: phosphoglycerate kinase [Candidatus Aenigmarchaeota archaeon]|nr:phosphoglycerate kinase [Candidatus Aenigmarchaeota archaeon]MCX8190690.1 phosphoglycerate kinase [Candidatus Aenigmarchaeota archaeon]MDW8159939.1 phosphoglycerate kinase [Candidatus Aenigmarchaeota archaeon]